MLGQPLLRRLRHLAPHVNSIGKEGLAALASHPRPLRLLELDLSLSAEMVADWDALLAKQALGSLTALKLTDPAPGSLAAMLPPERLPELRRLTLRGVPDLEDFQALLDNPLFGRLHDLRIDLAFETEGQQGPEVLRRLLAVWGTPSLRRLGLLWSLSAQGSPFAGRRPTSPALPELELGAFRMKAEGMTALAGGRLLSQLRRLVFRNSSSQEVPGLEALADSPQCGPRMALA